MKKFGVIALAGMVTGFLMVGPLAARAEDTDKGQKEQEAQKVTLDQLPAVVKNALVKATEGGAIQEIEKKIEKTIKGDKTVYEADFTKDGKKMEIKLDETGKVLKTKAADEDKQEGEQD